MKVHFLLKKQVTRKNKPDLLGTDGNFHLFCFHKVN